MQRRWLGGNSGFAEVTFISGQSNAELAARWTVAKKRAETGSGILAIDLGKGLGTGGFMFLHAFMRRLAQSLAGIALSPVHDSNRNVGLVLLSEQCRHQLRLHRQWLTWWVPWIFVIGLCVSVLGMVLAIAAFREEGTLARLGVFGLFVAFFGWVVLLWLIGPLLIRPRIVPYFTRQLGEYRGKTMSAFLQGRGLYREIVALEQLAHTLGVKPLSTFGFAYDYYEQEVQWHSAAEGLRTVEALRQGLDARLTAAPALVADLDALAHVIRAAANCGVDFSLVLRLHATDNMQAVCTRETRQGSFW